MTKKTGMTIRVDHEELQEFRLSLAGRRAEIEKIRSKMEAAGLSTFTCDSTVEVLDRCKVAIGDEPEDMFSVDGDTGEIIE
jgi:hypothetical protein